MTRGWLNILSVWLRKCSARLRDWMQAETMASYEADQAEQAAQAATSQTSQQKANHALEILTFVYFMLTSLIQDFR